MTSMIASTSNIGNAGPPPDLSERYKLKSKYARLQRKYQHALLISKDLTLEVEEKEEKVQRLQDEVNLVIDQIYDSDYVHLAPKEDDLFSESEDETEETGGAGGKGEENGSDDEEEGEDETATGPSRKTVHANGKTRKHESSPERAIKRPRLEESQANH